MNDLTIVFYTANKISEVFAKNVRDHLISVTEKRIPIVSVSQRPMDFGTNICVGDIGTSAYNVYKQILIGARAVKTSHIACCEDDTLYVPEHFTHRPLLNNEFIYNLNRWSITPNPPNPLFFYRNRAVMSQCIAPTQLVLKTLEERYLKFPVYNSKYEKYWGEPGRCENALRIGTVNFSVFRTINPTIAFKHRRGLSGVRCRRPTDIIKNELFPWGTATQLWNSIYSND